VTATPDLEATLALLDRNPITRSLVGDYAELVDENDPEGMVQVCTSDGTPRIIMSRADWDAARKDYK